MISNILIYVDDLSHIEDYRKANVFLFLFGIKKYTIGYNSYSIDEISNLDVSNKYVILNRVLDCKGIDELKQDLPSILAIPNLKGIVFEDIGVYNILKDMNLDIELILYQNHFCTNSRSINFWLDRVDSVFVSNELTKKEYERIDSHVNKKVCYHLFGRNQVMYSRRSLLSNWCDNFKEEKRSTSTIVDRGTKTKFKLFENEYGTVFYSGNIFDGKDLLTLKNVKYFYVNPTFIDHEDVMKFLNDYNSDILGTDDGFLNKETIYKLKERAK